MHNWTFAAIGHRLSRQLVKGNGMNKATHVKKLRNGIAVMGGRKALGIYSNVADARRLASAHGIRGLDAVLSEFEKRAK